MAFSAAFNGACVTDLRPGLSTFHLLLSVCYLKIKQTQTPNNKTKKHTQNNPKYGYALDFVVQVMCSGSVTSPVGDGGWCHSWDTRTRQGPPALGVEGGQSTRDISDESSRTHIPSQFWEWAGHRGFTSHLKAICSW